MTKIYQIWAWVFLFAFTSSVQAETYIVRFDSKLSEEKALIRLKEFGLKSVFANYELNMFVAETEGAKALDDEKMTSMSMLPEVSYVEPNATWYVNKKPNDSKYGSQGKLRGMNIEKAWDITTGSNSVVVGVVDSGVDVNHEDLKNQIAINANEIPNNNIDDDNNGFIDDVNGWDFYQNDKFPDDLAKHGTHVSGIIGAEGNNLKGIAGVNWQVKIMPLRFIGPTGAGGTADAVRAITYAINNGVQILNFSFGGPTNSQGLKDAIQHALYKGINVIVASGNNRNNLDITPSYPASYDFLDLVTVGASDTPGTFAEFANYSPYSVSLAAPGVDINSTLPGNKYSKLSGTSMAAPAVSGVAALMLSVDPTLSVIQVKNGLVNATVEKSSYVGKVISAGELDAFLAVSQLNNKFQVWPRRIYLPLNKNYWFSTYKATGNVTWSIDDGSVATIDPDGLLVGHKNGYVTVTATDSSGQVAKTEKIVVGKPSTPPPKPTPTASPSPSSAEGGGCSNSTESQTNQQQANSLLGLSFPLATVAVLRRRQKNKTFVSNPKTSLLDRSK